MNDDMIAWSNMPYLLFIMPSPVLELDDELLSIPKSVGYS